MSERRTTVDCQHVEAALIAYLKEGLSPARRQVVEDHLAGCEACARSLQQAQTLESELRLQAARHNPALSPQASARIRERVYRRMRRGLIMQRTVKLVGVAVAVVAIALLAVGVAALWQGRSPEVAVEEDVTPEFSEGAPTLSPAMATSVPATGVPEATPSAGDTWTRPVDGAEMVYVPAGEFLMGSSEDDPDAEDHEKPQHAVYLDAFWIDKTEVTHAQYRKCVEAGACRAFEGCEPRQVTLEEATNENNPVVCVSWKDAQDYAAWVGGRLPTEAEWEKAARGSDGRLYPWGNSPPDCSKANYADCNEGPAAGVLPVGSRPDGASLYGAMDMASNVYEWVADWWDEGYYSGSPARNPQGPESGSVRVIRGGGFNGSQDRARCARRGWYYPEFEVGWRTIGFRVVVDPGAPVPPTSEPEATPGAGDTWTRPVDGAEMVYVPAGEFLMGSSDDDPDADDDEKPQHTVYLDAFWIDRTEVTNAQYRKCVEAGACEEPRYWDDDDVNAPDQPVLGVTGYEAQAYAAWVGGRLPTEAEWEKAARGTDGRIYPWGNEPPDCDKANYEGCGVGKASAVGSYPDGASPYGVLDMAGNVYEWSRSLYKSYPYRADDGREDLEAVGIWTIRGGSWYDDQTEARSAFRFQLSPLYWGRCKCLGFRVAVDLSPSGPPTSVSEPTATSTATPAPGRQ